MKAALSFTTRNIPVNFHERKKYLIEFYKRTIQGKSVVNMDTGLTINFTYIGRKKTAKRHNSVETTVVIKNIMEVLRNAVYNNFGEPQPHHIKKFGSIKSFVNFKIKVVIDGEVKNYRICCLILKGNKVQYDLHESSIEYAIKQGKNKAML
jgi:hypothetical protein